MRVDMALTQTTLIINRPPPWALEIAPRPNKIFTLCSRANLIHNFLFCALLLRIATQCSLHAWGEQSSTKKHNRSYHPAYQVEEGVLAS